MIEKKTIIDNISINRNNEINISLAFQLIEDGEEIGISYKYLTVPKIDIDGTIATINMELEQIKKQPINDYTKLKAIIELYNSDQFQAMLK